MHILLTDVLTCPRCGPNFGVIVLADRLADRWILEGQLGCANCRESYPIAGGVVDLRHPGVPAIEAVMGVDLQAEQAFRTAALLGVQAAKASILVIEPAGEVGAAIAELLPELHVLDLSIDAPFSDRPERGTLSRLRAGRKLPLRSRSLHGAAALGVKVEPMLDDILRVLVRGGRLVVDPAPVELTETLASAGFTVLLEQEGVVVAAAPEAR
ncbi:MAG TPA: Trm112 family protein [Longimicrobiaceae bacterium]|nr:Trm112 family protein [Longimicrobiaceae bacterium]